MARRNSALMATGIRIMKSVTGESIGVQRRVFRVEQMFGERRTSAPPETAAGEHDAIDCLKAPHQLDERRAIPRDELKRELALVQEVIARNRNELAALIGESKTRRMARAAGELGAAVDCMEKATHKILQAAEDIDDRARSLDAALKTEFDRGLTQDIQDHTTQIDEACNFHDLAGQRIAKVIATLNMVEEQLAGMLARCDTLGGYRDVAAPAESAEKGGLLNGPKLDGDSGHATQGDIDAIFG
jgi:chemotaxis protein CheZ